jgi:hypothetical protein
MGRAVPLVPCAWPATTEGLGAGRTAGMGGVTVKQYDVLGYEVGGRHRVGPLRRVPMTLASDRAQGQLGSNVPDDERRVGLNCSYCLSREGPPSS